MSASRVRSRFFALVGLILLVLILGGGVRFAQVRKAIPAPVTGSVAIKGEMVCLPHKHKGDFETMECVYGLKGDDGSFYGILSLSQKDLMDGVANIGQRVKIEGVLESAEASERYDIKANIRLGSISLLAEK